MIGILQPEDPERVREDGEVFGRAVGLRTATEMTKSDPGQTELASIGSEGVSAILAKANALADGGLKPDLVTAWIDAAAEAFYVELARAATLLSAPEVSGSKH